jgi:hypothetical protein
MPHGHEHLDRASLEMARRIAAELPRRPEWLSLARENLSRWSRRNHNAPGLLRCYQEWQTILERPVSEVCAVLTQENDEGQRLRQNSPFAGALTPQEIWAIKERARRDPASA